MSQGLLSYAGNRNSLYEYSIFTEPTQKELR